MSSLVEQVRAALEVVRTYRGKKVVRICGRSASTLVQVEQAALLEGMTQEEFDSLALGDPSGSNAAPDTQSPTSLEGPPQHETSTFRLDPGSAVLRTDGMLPIVIEGGESAPVWSAPGDFKLFLEPGEDEHTGLVRELLVGSFRSPEDSDFEQSQGVFFTDPEWEFVSGSLKNRIFELETQIGFLAGTKQSEESKPRAESWLAERAEADAKLAAASELVGVLEGKLAVAIDTPSRASALPENALELIQQASGLSKPKAEAVLAALTAPAQEQQ